MGHSSLNFREDLFCSHVCVTGARELLCGFANPRPTRYALQPRVNHGAQFPKLSGSFVLQLRVYDGRARASLRLKGHILNPSTTSIMERGSLNFREDFHRCYACIVGVRKPLRGSKKI